MSRTGAGPAFSRASQVPPSRPAAWSHRARSSGRGAGSSSGIASASPPRVASASPSCPAAGATTAPSPSPTGVVVRAPGAGDEAAQARANTRAKERTQAA